MPFITITLIQLLLDILLLRLNLCVKSCHLVGLFIQVPGLLLLLVIQNVVRYPFFVKEWRDKMHIYFLMRFNGFLLYIIAFVLLLLLLIMMLLTLFFAISILNS